jgi:hypothetical protein
MLSLFIEMEVSLTFCPGWPQTIIPHHHFQSRWDYKPEPPFSAYFGTISKEKEA